MVSWGESSQKMVTKIKLFNRNKKGSNIMKIKYSNDLKTRWQFLTFCYEFWCLKKKMGNGKYDFAKQIGFCLRIHTINNINYGFPLKK